MDVPLQWGVFDKSLGMYSMGHTWIIRIRLQAPIKGLRLGLSSQNGHAKNLKILPSFNLSNLGKFWESLSV